MPTITNGGQYMQAITYTGTGSTQTIAVGFQPDFVWIKSRSAATDHKLTDSVRGVTKALISDTTGAETTDANGVTAFTSNGFTIGSDSVYNTNAATYVAWCWKAGGTSSSNTNGYITSTVSVNATAGFSVVTFTGVPTSAGTSTVGHGLGVAPKFIILKNRDLADNWYCYNANIGNGNYISLNTTGASTAGAVWANTTPTSTVFSITNGSFNSTTAQKLVTYCFSEVAGYSKFGSYTGNGSNDGPFVYLGFRPRFVMIKCINDAAAPTYASWIIYDSSRNTYNETNNTLLANFSTAENTRGNGSGSMGSIADIDLLSNGVKIRGSAGVETNVSGETYIYAAFAENPFKNALAR